MPEDVAVMDSPEIGSTDLDLGATTTDETSGSDDGSQSTEQIDTHDEPQEGETGHLRGKELYRAVKDKLKNGEKLSPQELKSVRNAIHIAGRADEATGGDLGKFESERAVFEQLRSQGEESLTPEQLVEGIKADRQQLGKIFEDIRSGSPALIDEVATDFPDAFPQLAISAMDKFATLNNEAFSTYVAKSAFGYLSQQQIPQQFALLDRFLPESSADPATQIVIDAFKVIKTGLQGLGTMAAKNLDIKKPAAKTDAQGNPKETDVATREHNVRRQEWDMEASPVNRQLRDTELQQILTSRKAQLTEKERTQVLAAIKEEFDTRMSLHKNTLKGYVDANNKRAYTDRVTSEGKKMLPSMVQRHVNAVLDGRPKNGPKTEVKPGQKQQPVVDQGRKDATGAVWLSGSPASLGLQVDYNKTTQGMLVRNEAYVKGRSGLHKWKSKVA
jgi:hypothetical protein